MTGRRVTFWGTGTTHVMASETRTVCGKAVPNYYPKHDQPGRYNCRRCTPETEKA